MNLIKRILAVLGLISAAAFVVCTIIMLCTKQPGEGFGLMLVPLCLFLAFGLSSLGIRWLQNLKADALKEAMEEEARKKAARDAAAKAPKDEN